MTKDRLTLSEEDLALLLAGQLEINSGGGFTYLNEFGEPHRDGAPAIIWTDGTEIWCQHGKLHRVAGPAIVWSDSADVDMGPDEFWVLGERVEPF